MNNLLRTMACIGLLVVSTEAWAQRAGDIVDRYIEVIKKTSNADEFPSVYFRGEVCYKAKLCFPVEMWWKNERAMRMEMRFQEMKFIMVANDSLTWEHNPLEDTDKVEVMTDEMAKKNRNSEYVSRELIAYKTNGGKLNYKGSEKLDSVDVYVIDYTNKTTRSTYYINTRSYLIHKIEKDDNMYLFFNYLDFNGVYFPRYVVERGAEENLRMRFDEVKPNLQFHDSLFVIPDEIIRKHHQEKLPMTISKFDEVYNEAIAYYSNGTYDSALIYFNRAIALDNSSWDAYNYRGLTKLELQEHYAAIADFTRVLEIDKSNASAYNNLGYTKYLLGDYKASVTDYQKAIELNPSMTVAYANRGLAYFRLEDYEKAYDDFVVATKNEPESSVHFYNRGVTLAQLDKDEEALQDFAISLSLGDTSAGLLNYKGVSEYKLERYDSAEISFTKALALEPDNTQYLINLGNTYYNMDNYSKAMTCFEKALAIDENDESYNMMGLCHLMEENYEQASGSFSAAIRLNPKNAVYFDNRALAKQHLDDFVGAIQDYDESIKLYPNDPQVFYNRGMVKIRTSKKYEGCLDLATANEMKYEPAREAIMENCH